MPDEPLTINHQPAFSLIELLIGITIIGILSSITAIALTGHQKKARDAQRKSDLRQISTAMQAAKNDCKNGLYYPIGFYAASNKPLAQLDYAADSSSLQTVEAQLIAGNYLRNPLRAPMYDTQETNGLYLWRYEISTSGATILPVCPDTSGSLTLSGSTNYILRAKLESPKDDDLKKSWTVCGTQARGTSWYSNWPLLTTPPEALDDSPPYGIDDNNYYYVCND